MKNMFFVLLCAGFLSSCATKSTFQKMPPPNFDLTYQNLQSHGIDPTSLVGVYVSFTTAGQFYKDSQANRNEGVDGGVYIQHDILSGQSLYQPQFVPVLYQSGKDKGKPVKDKKTGRMVTDDFLGEIVQVEIDKGIPVFWVHIDDPSGGAVFPFTLAPSTKQPGKFQDKFLLRITESSIVSGGKTFFPLQDQANQLWFAQNPGMGLAKMYYAKSTENQTQTNVGTTKRVGL